MSAGPPYYVRDVFTPATPARLTFVERETINKKLVNALRTPGKQVVVYGHSGSGKTTLLINKLEQLYEAHVVSRCMRGVSFEQLLLEAFDQLSPFYIAEKSSEQTEHISATIKAEYLGIKSQLGVSLAKSVQQKEQRVLPPQLTPQALARFLGVAKCCWVLEDFHKADEAEKTKVSQLMKVFMDMADAYNDLKIIAIGAVDTARQVVEYDPDMRNRVAEIKVPLMTPNELGQIIAKGEHLLNIQFNPVLKKGIVHYSNGLASVCHSLCLNLCVAAGTEITNPRPFSFSDSHMRSALSQYLDEASDSLKRVFDIAFKRKRSRQYDNCRVILYALAQCPSEGATYAQILKRIIRVVPEYPQGNLTLYLRELQSSDRGGIVRFDSTSRTFFFSDPIYRSFCLVYFEDHPLAKEKESAYISAEKISEILAQLAKDLEKSLKGTPPY